MIIKDWSHIASGTHGSVKKALIQNGEFEGYVCIKLFTEEWEEAYEREALAYELLLHRGVRRCVPEVYWKGCFPISRLDSGSRSTTQDPDEKLYWLVMEFFEDCRPISYESLDIPTAEAVCHGLSKIHEARVRHGDLQEQNILLVREGRGSARVVWIDFSCAWLQPHPKALLREYDGLLGSLRCGMVQPDNVPY